MKISPKNSILTVIDIQGNLAHKVHNKDAIIANCQKLIRTAYHLNIPILYTEQAPDKIGATISEIKELLMGNSPIPKMTFSCLGQEEFKRRLNASKAKHIILCGIESHVCVYQTCMDLLDENLNVHIVADAISSRNPLHHSIALERMKQCGGIITCTEMLITELLKSSAHPKFKEILSLIK